MFNFDHILILGMLRHHTVKNEHGFSKLIISTCFIPSCLQTYLIEVIVYPHIPHTNIAAPSLLSHGQLPLVRTS